MEIRAQQTFYNRKEHKRRAHNNFCKSETHLLARFKTSSLPTPRDNKNNLINLFAKEIFEEEYRQWIYDTSKEIAIGSKGARKLIFRKKVMIQERFLSPNAKCKLYTVQAYETPSMVSKEFTSHILATLKKKKSGSEFEKRELEPFKYSIVLW